MSHTPAPVKLYVCINQRSGVHASCGGRGSLKLIKALEAEIAVRTLSAMVERSICFGHCDKGPNIKVGGGDFIHGAAPEDAGRILDDLFGRQP